MSKNYKFLISFRYLQMNDLLVYKGTFIKGLVNLFNYTGILHRSFFSKKKWKLVYLGYLVFNYLGQKTIWKKKIFFLIKLLLSNFVKEKVRIFHCFLDGRLCVSQKQIKKRNTSFYITFFACFFNQKKIVLIFKNVKQKSFDISNKW